jgi:hypothetical protein
MINYLKNYIIKMKKTLAILGGASAIALLALSYKA